MSASCRAQVWTQAAHGVTESVRETWGAKPGILPSAHPGFYLHATCISLAPANLVTCKFEEYRCIHLVLLNQYIATRENSKRKHQWCSIMRKTFSNYNSRHVFLLLFLLLMWCMNEPSVVHLLCQDLGWRFYILSVLLRAKADVTTHYPTIWSSFSIAPFHYLLRYF